MTRTHALPRRRAAVWTPLLAVLVLLGGCTGTEEHRDPVLLVVAGGDHVGLVEDRIAPDRTRTLTWLPDARHDFGDDAEVVDLAVAREAGPDEAEVHVLVLYRTTGGDGTSEELLQRFDATFVPTDEADRFRPVGAPVSLSDVVADSGVLAGDPLCTRFATADATGRWLGLLHDGDACGPDDGTTTTILVDLEEGEEGEVAEPPVGSVPSAAEAPPVFEPGGGYLWWLEETVGLVSARTYAAEATSTTNPRLEFDELGTVEGFGRMGGGWLAIAAADEILAFEPGGEDPVRRESENDLQQVVDAASLADPAAVLLTGNGLVVHPDVTEEDDPVVEEEPVYEGPLDATIHPDGFVYVLTEVGTIRLFDLLPMLDETYDWSPRIAATGPDPIADPVAIDWIHGVAPEDESADVRRR